MLTYSIAVCDDVGQFLNDVGHHADAASSYLTAAQLSPDDFELIFNTASALRSLTNFLLFVWQYNTNTL